MTAIVYLGEIFVASLLAIGLLAISHSRMSGGTALFVGGVMDGLLPNILFTALCCMALRHPNTGCIMPTLTRRSSQSFGRSGFVSPCPI